MNKRTRILTIVVALGLLVATAPYTLRRMAEDHRLHDGDLGIFAANNLRRAAEFILTRYAEQGDLPSPDPDFRLPIDADLVPAGGFLVYGPYGESIRSESLPNDPFQSDGPMWEFTAYIGSDPKPATIEGGQLLYCHLSGPYFLIGSVGIDRKQDFDLEYLSSLEFASIDEIKAEVSGLAYDPTNGSRSAGDMYYLGDADLASLLETSGN